MKKALALAGLICMVASVSAGRLWTPNRLAFVPLRDIHARL
jgi:hypothetical protein